MLLEALGHPEHEFAVVHVGGTNGKGSVSALVYSALLEAGHSVALYSSPHLVDIRERMVVNGRPIAPDAFARWTSVLRETIETAGASFFEATTAVAFAHFAAMHADVAIVEVGLGGRLDSTNVVDPLLSVVTLISRDHEEYLGDSLDGIAREKGGIAKAGRPFLIGEEDPVLVRVLESVAGDRRATPIVIPAGETYAGALRLMGEHQRRNAAVAEHVLANLPAEWRPPHAATERGFARTILPGRFDCRGKWIFDVAHNPGGMEIVARTLGETRAVRPLHALVGVLGDKDWVGMIETVIGAVDRVWITTPESAPVGRRWDLDAVRERFSGSVMVEPSFALALEQVQLGAGTVLVTGSCHTVGDAMARLPGFAPLG